MDTNATLELMLEVVEILKTRFPGLTVSEVNGLAKKIVLACDAVMSKPLDPILPLAK